MIWFFLATVFVVYFMVVAGYTGLESKFHMTWLILAFVATFLGVLEDQNAKGMIQIPKAFLVMGIIVGVAVLLIILAVVFRILKDGRNTAEAGAAYLIVLGAHINGIEVSRALQNRLETARQYYRSNPDVKILLSGGQGPGEDRTEAEAMQEYLLRKGIPEDCLIMEDASFSTEENIANCRKLVDLENQKLVLVTNRFHLYRSLCVCRKQGLKQVQGLPAEDHPIMIPTYYLREVLAILNYRWKKKI